MKRRRSRYIILSIAAFLLVSANAMAQKAEREYIRKGNRSFNDTVYTEAEVNYRKAIETNPQSAVAMYNLGRTLSQQNKAKDAMEQYATASKMEKDKKKLGQIYRNIGVLQQSNRDYAKAVDAYKMSLRNDPTDDETRYNLALAQKMLKDQQQQQDNKDKKDDQKEQDKDKKDDEKKKEDKKEQQQQQSKPQQNQMSKENAEQMLNAAMQDEKDVQDKVKKRMQVVRQGQLEKDW
ncbi:MAG: tetratricopeptide repeat protein [Mediterranea sp.]|nr:tetratricopeptide repeat protein [Mediterranea sp.]